MVSWPFPFGDRPDGTYRAIGEPVAPPTIALVEDTMSFELAVDEHAPRTVGDPFYIPWWAKVPKLDGEPKTYRAWDGTEIQGGKIVTRGSSFRGFEATMRQPQKVVRNETPPPSLPEVLPLRSKPAVKANIPDWASEALREAGKCPDARAKLCSLHGIDYAALVAGAPNAGVATMRIVNALRRSSKK